MNRQSAKRVNEPERIMWFDALAFEETSHTFPWSGLAVKLLKNDKRRSERKSRQSRLRWAKTMLFSAAFAFRLVCHSSSSSFASLQDQQMLAILFNALVDCRLSTKTCSSRRWPSCLS